MKKKTPRTRSHDEPVEKTHVPKLVVQGKSNEPLIEVFANAYVVGSREELLTNGKRGYPLYYLSLVAPRGSGTSLQALFARLVNVHSKGAQLEGVGDVFLAHHRPRVAACGYTVHWNFEQAEVLPDRDLHAVIESNMLTIADPVRAMAVKPRKERSALSASTTKPHAKSRASLSSAKAGKTQLSLKEVRARELHPLFLLLVPGWLTDETARDLLHFAFLDPRVPWPLDPSWARFLWDRGVERGEIEPLQVWSFLPRPDEEDNGDAEELTAVPFLSEAFLCRPDLVHISQDLSHALREDRLPVPSVSPLRPEEVPIPSHIATVL